MAEASEEKTEQATPEKLKRIRKLGQVWISRDFDSAAGLVILWAILLAVISSSLSTDMVDASRELLRQGSAGAPIASAIPMTTLLFTQSLGWFLLLVLPVAAVGMLAAFLQVGPLFALDPMTPRAQNIDPIKGLQRMFFSLRGWMEVFKSVQKFLVVFVVVALTIYWELGPILSSSRLDVLQASQLILAVVVRCIGFVALYLLAFSFVDILYQRWQFYKDVRMTKTEAKREYKEQEGDPLVKWQRRRVMREASEHGMIETARTADVMLANPTHVICALRYDPQKEKAPRLIAKGVDHLAERLRRVAREEGIPIVRNVGLARALLKVDDGHTIPPELWLAVVEVLKWVESTAEHRARKPKWIEVNPASLAVTSAAETKPIAPRETMK
jgi:flagellar biosynthesis protein FlhB